MPRNILEQHLPAGCCFSTLGWGCALCPGSRSPLTSWKDSTFLWKNFTPLCVSLGSTNSSVTGKLKVNVQYQDTSSALEIIGIKPSPKFFQSQKHLDAAPSIPILSFLSCNKYTPGLTVNVLPPWDNEQEFQSLFPVSWGCISAYPILMCRMKIHTCSRGNRSSCTHLLVSQGR